MEEAKPTRIKKVWEFSEENGDTDNAFFFEPWETGGKRLMSLRATQDYLNLLEAKVKLADSLREHFDPDHGEMCDGLCEFLDAYDAIGKVPA